MVRPAIAIHSPVGAAGQPGSRGLSSSCGGDAASAKLTSTATTHSVPTDRGGRRAPVLRAPDVSYGPTALRVSGTHSRLSSATETLDDTLARQWAQLVADTGSAPFLGVEWFSTWCAAFRPRAVPSALTVRADGRLVGLLPCTTSRVGGPEAPWAVRRGATNGESPWTALLVAPGADLDAVTSAFACSAAAAPLDVGLLLLDVSGRALTEALGSSESVSTVRPSRVSVVVETDPTDDVEARLGRRRRQNLRRTARRLAELGDVEFSADTAPDPTWPDGFALEAAGWKGREGTAVLRRPRTLTFYRQVCGSAAARGELRVHSLRAGGRLVASSLALQHAGTSYLWKVAVDDGVRDLGPGLQLLHRVVLDAQDRADTDRLVVLGEDDPWKREFGTGSLEQVDLKVFGRGPIARAGALAEEGLCSARRSAATHLSPETRRRWARRLHLP